MNAEVLLAFDVHVVLTVLSSPQIAFFPLGGIKLTANPRFSLASGHKFGVEEGEKMVAMVLKRITGVLSFSAIFAL